MSDNHEADDAIAKQIVKLASRDEYELDYREAQNGEKRASLAIKFYAVAPAIGAIALATHEHFDAKENFWTALTAGTISLIGATRSKTKQDDYKIMQRIAVKEAAEISKELGIDQESWTLRALRETE